LDTKPSIAPARRRGDFRRGARVAAAAQPKNPAQTRGETPMTLWGAPWQSGGIPSWSGAYRSVVIVEANSMRKIPTTVVALAVLPLIAIGLAVGQPSPADSADKAAQPAKPAPPVPSQAQVDAARRAFDEAYRNYTVGISHDLGSIDQVHLWSQRLMEAERDRAADPAARTAALEAHINRMRQFEQISTGRYQHREAGVAAAAAAEYFRLQAEFTLAKEKADSENSAANP